MAKIHTNFWTNYFHIPYAVNTLLKKNPSDLYGNMHLVFVCLFTELVVQR